MQKFKSMTAHAAQPDDMWSTGEFLTQARNSIDKKYDYQYSQLEFVFDRLLREGGISEETLSGLSEEKMHHIIHISTM
jgi:galactokinase